MDSTTNKVEELKELIDKVFQDWAGCRREVLRITSLNNDYAATIDSLTEQNSFLMDQCEKEANKVYDLTLELKNREH